MGVKTTDTTYKVYNFFFYFHSTQVFITLNSFKSVDLRRCFIVLGVTTSHLYAIGSVPCNCNRLLSSFGVPRKGKKISAGESEPQPEGEQIGIRPKYNVWCSLPLIA